MKNLNKIDPFEEEIWDEDYKPSLRKEPVWITIGGDFSGFWGSSMFSGSTGINDGTNNSSAGITGHSGIGILPEIRKTESTSFGKKIRRKGPQPKYKNFPVKTDSRSEFIKKSWKNVR